MRHTLATRQTLLVACRGAGPGRGTEREREKREGKGRRKRDKEKREDEEVALLYGKILVQYQRAQYPKGTLRTSHGSCTLLS